MKIYTRTGDDGTTGVLGGTRVPKTSRRIVAYGAVDEVNAALGVSLACGPDGDVSDVLTRVQNDLFVLGADMSNPDPDDDSNRVTEQMVRGLESSIDGFEGELPRLENFVLPGGNALAAHLHHARTVARRAEIRAVLLGEGEHANPLCAVYLNRLSDLLFVLARIANRRGGRGDVAWKAKDTL